MKISKDTKILIIGLGVIGGSYAKALTDKGFTVNCITRSAESIEYAKSNGMIAYGTTEVDTDLVSTADLIVFALYPSVFIDWIKKYSHYLKIYRKAWLIIVENNKS